MIIGVFIVFIMMGIVVIPLTAAVIYGLSILSYSIIFSWEAVFIIGAVINFIITMAIIISFNKDL